MDISYLIERGDDAIAGFKQTVDGECKQVWCAECAIADGETPPYIAEETELDLPEFDDIDGSIGPVLYIYYDQYAELEGNDPEVIQDLSDVTCDECGQRLQPE